MNLPKCTCPQSTSSRGELVRYTDQLCPIHGTKKQELPHCATCTCGGARQVERTTSHNHQ